MVKLKNKVLKNAKIDTINALVRVAEREHTTKWTGSEDDQKLTITLKNKGTIVIMFPKEETGDFKLQYDVKGETFVSEIDRIESNKITERNVKDSIFEGTFNSITNGDYMKLGKNLFILNELEKSFKDMGINKVGFSRTLNGENSIDDISFDKISVIFTPSTNNYGKSVRMRGISKLRDKWSSLEGYKNFDINDCYVPTPISNEKIIDFKVEGIKVGEYYKDRNIVFITFNPFKNFDLGTIGKIKDNKYLEHLLSELKKAFVVTKVKRQLNKDFKTRLTVEKFNAHSKSKIVELNSQLKSVEKELDDYQTCLTNLYSKRISYNKQLESLSIIGSDAVKSFITEMDKTAKLPIIDSVSLDNGTFNITYKPTTIKVNFGRSVDESKAFGIREIYLGKITCHISGDGKIRVSSDVPCISKHPHPHATEDGRPCLGSGQGPITMNQLIGERRFSEFVYVFWMWIKRWRPEDCYVKPWNFYDDRLQQGLPVFDNTGKRITINDKAKLKTGEQIQLSENGCYNKNLLKFNKFKPTN